MLTRHSCNHPGTHPTVIGLYTRQTTRERVLICTAIYIIIRSLWLSVNNICWPGASVESHHVLIACIQSSYTILDANYRLYCAKPGGLYSVAGSLWGVRRWSTPVVMSGHVITTESAPIIVIQVR